MVNKKRKPGGGRKKKYNEKTTTIAFRVPESKVVELKAEIEKLKNSWMLRH